MYNYLRRICRYVYRPDQMTTFGFDIGDGDITRRISCSSHGLSRNRGTKNVQKKRPYQKNGRCRNLMSSYRSLYRQNRYYYAKQNDGKKTLYE